jgi:hypothetical protein
LFEKRHLVISNKQPGTSNLSFIFQTNISKYIIMKKIAWIAPIIFTAIIILLASGCKKEEHIKPPVFKSASDSLNNSVVKDNPLAIDADGNVYTSVTLVVKSGLLKT